MDRFRVVICGGGVAAVEGLLRLRRLVGDSADVQLVAPNEDFAFRALSVKEPFAMPSAPRFSLQRIARDQDAELVEDKLDWLDPDGQLVHTEAGEQLPYDALLLAVGGRLHAPYEHVTTFNDADANETFTGVVQDIEGGYTKSVAFLAPDGPAWPLPLYELALMTSERAAGMDMGDVSLTVVTPEPAPLAGFGRQVSDAVTGLLQERRIDVYTSSTALVPEAQHLLIQPSGAELHPGRMIAMPRISGPSIRGIADAGAHGFIPIDKHCAVPGTGGRVFAAGDATAFPIKHGGLGAQQADTAAAGIARLAGAEVEAASYHPVLHGMLLTGKNPLYLTARVVGGRGFESEVSAEPTWGAADKVTAEELGPYLAGSSLGA